MRNKLKMSYLISTIKPKRCAEVVVNQILSFPKHEKEIVIISPDKSWEEDKRVKFCLDDKCTGGVYGFNKGCRESNGDMVVLCTDDNYLPANFVDIYDFFSTPEFQARTMKVANICPWQGGPGKVMLFKRAEDQYLNGTCSFYEEDFAKGGVFPRGLPNAMPYEIFSYPVIFRETLDKFFDGAVYNDRFIQCYSDHWFGFHYERFKGNDPAIGPKDMYVVPIPGFGSLRIRHDTAEQDRQMFLQLVKNSPNTTKYNC